jgi:hypothetical protein
MIKRIVGIALLVVGVIGVILAIAGILIGTQLINGIGTAAKDTLALATDGLNTTKATLEQTKTTMQTAQTGLEDVEKTISDVGDTVIQSDALVNEALTMATTDIPDAIDQVVAVAPSTAETTQNLLTDIGATMAGTASIVEQNGPLVNQSLKIVTSDVPDTLDQVNAIIPGAVENTQSVLDNIESTLVNSSMSVDQADAALDQVIQMTSQDVPNTIDAVNAYIPGAAATAQSVLGNVETTMVATSQSIDQVDLMLDQMVQVASRDLPANIDYWSAYIPLLGDATKDFLGDVETTMVDASQAVDQADAMVDQTLKVASEDVPNTIDYWKGYIPANTAVAQAYLDSAEATVDATRTSMEVYQPSVDLISELVSEQTPDSIDAWNEILPLYVDPLEQNIDAALDLLDELNYVDGAGAYSVQLDQAANQLSANLDLLSRQLRAMDYVVDYNVAVADAGLLAADQNVDALRAQVDQLAGSAAYLDLLSSQLREVDSYYNDDLEAISDYLLALSDDVAAINDQVDAYVALSGQLGDISDQLRALEVYSETDLEPWSAYVLALSKDVSAINEQIDGLVALSGQLGDVSDQLRTFEAYSDNNLGAISQDIMALSENVGVYNEQIGQLGEAAGQLEVLADSLRAMEPYADIDTKTISSNLLALSGNVGAINQQIDEFVKLLPQLEQLSGSLRAMESYAGEVDIETIGQDVKTLSEDVATINAQIGEFVVLVDQYIAVVDNINTTIGQVQTNLDGQLSTAKTIIVIAMLWILLAQLAPLYLGWELVMGQREGGGTVSTSAATP